MTRFIKWLFIVFFLFGMLLGVLTTLSIDEQSSVAEPRELSSDELNRVKQFIKKNEPANLLLGEVASTRIKQQDLNDTFNYLLNKLALPRGAELRAKVVFDSNQALLIMSLGLPSNPLGKFINIRAIAQIANPNDVSSFEILTVKIGKIAVPKFIAQRVFDYLNTQLILKVPEYSLTQSAMKRVQFREKELSVNYVWGKQEIVKIRSQLSSRIITDEFKQALLAHAEHLSLISQSFVDKIEFNQLLRPMFEFARIRSESKNPVVENKALFVVMGAYALDKNIHKILGETIELKARNKQIYLKNRSDLSRHLALSAAITSIADPRLAKAIGLQKEVNDSQGGSGFSFVDLAADKAGVIMAKESASSIQSARRMQVYFSKVESESDYMPDISNLPEGIDEYAFRERYIDTNSQQYKKIERLIINRLSVLPAYIGN